jgi:hypothetical protein
MIKLTKFGSHKLDTSRINFEFLKFAFKFGKIIKKNIKTLTNS